MMLAAACRPRTEAQNLRRTLSGLTRGHRIQKQIIGILREQEAGGAVKEIIRRHGISEQSFYRWKAKYGGMEVSEARRLRELEAENGKLKRLLAEAHLDNAALKDVLGRKW